MPELLASAEELNGELERRRTGQRIEEEADSLARDLSAFVKAAWPYVEPSTPYVHNWHIDAICEHLQAVSDGDLLKLQVWVPPGSMKSTLCSILWPAWEWTSKPGMRYWTGSYGLNLSRQLTAKSRDLITGPWYQSRWGHLFRMKKTNEGYFSNTRGGTRVAASPDGGGTGQHGHRILVDDPLDPQKIESFQAPALEKANGWYDGTVSTRGVGDYAEVIIMQRLHERDLAAHAYAYGGWTVLCLPEEYEAAHPFVWPGDPRTEDGELLWPELFGPAKHDERKRMGAHKAAGRLQQRPAAREGELLKRGLWRYYDPAALAAAYDGDVSQLPAFQGIVCSWDTTFKEKNTSDFVAGGVFGQVGADRYLLRTWHQRASLSATKVAMKEMRAWALERWPLLPVWTLIENTANGPEIVAQLQREVTGVIATKPSVAADQPPAKKTVRAEACEPDFEAGNVYVPGARNTALDDYDPARTPAWAQEVIEQAAAFPNAAHDDLVDMLTQALNWLRAKGTGRGRVTSPASMRLPQTAGVPIRR